MNPPPTPPEEGSQCRSALAEFPSWEGPGVGRFMESPLSFFRMHWDHEPPLTRPPATLSPSAGEREGVRGRFMESLAPPNCATTPQLVLLAFVPPRGQDYCSVVEQRSERRPGRQVGQ